jgi:hypothetical protein
VNLGPDLGLEPTQACPILVVTGMQAMIARIMASPVALRTVGILQSRPAFRSCLL